MKARFMKIRYKIIFAYILSAMLSGVSLLVASIIFIVAFNDSFINILKWINVHVTAIPLILLTIIIVFFILMSSIFLMLTKRSTDYLEEITQTLQTVASGDLDINIDIKTKDELGEVANIINNMTVKLKSLIDAESRWEKGKSELITNLSHDLRTPLTSILGYIELLSKQKYKDEANLQQYIDVIHNKCTQLNNLIDDLFQYSKLEISEVTINKTKINIVELLEQVMMGFIPTLEKHKMEYRIHADKASILVLADPILLARLFDNLMNNAIKYGAQGKYIDIELSEESNKAVIKVINYGQKIPADKLPYIFERLYQIDQSRSMQKGGAGLGLAIVKRIIEIHHGEINVESNDDKTFFEVRLDNEVNKDIDLITNNVKI